MVAIYIAVQALRMQMNLVLPHHVCHMEQLTSLINRPANRKYYVV